MRSDFVCVYECESFKLFRSPKAKQNRTELPSTTSHYTTSFPLSSEPFCTRFAGRTVAGQFERDKSRAAVPAKEESFQQRRIV